MPKLLLVSKTANGTVLEGHLLVQVLDHVLGRLTSLESAVTEANKFAEAEAVRCEQSEAVTESLLARSQKHDKLLAQHGKVTGILCHNSITLIT